jgi:hypothetical protein
MSVAVPGRSLTFEFTLLEPPGTGRVVVANGINNRGEVIGHIVPGRDAADFTYYGFIYSAGHYELIQYPGAAYTTLLSINDRQQIIGSYMENLEGSPDVYFLYERGRFEEVEAPGKPVALNNRGDIIGHYSDGIDEWVGYLLRNGQIHKIKVPGSSGTFVTGINDHGEVVGGFWTGDLSNPVQGFRYWFGAYETFASSDPDAARATLPVGINNRGQITGTFRHRFGVRGFVYKRGAFTSFVVPESVYCQESIERPGTYVSGINDRGEIVGMWFSELTSGAYIAHPSRRPSPPAPSPCQ